MCARNRINYSEVVGFRSVDGGSDARWFDSGESYGGLGINICGKSKEEIERMESFGLVTHWMPLPEPPTK